LHFFFFFVFQTTAKKAESRKEHKFALGNFANRSITYWKIAENVLSWTEKQPSVEKLDQVNKELAFHLISPDNITRTWMILLRRLLLFVMPDFDAPELS
jgi:hypothetical protein